MKKIPSIRSVLASLVILLVIGSDLLSPSRVFAQANPPVTQENPSGTPAAPLATPAVPENAERIAEIRVEGNRAVQSDAVRGLMNTRVGSPLSGTDIRNDIRSIFGSGYFQDVRMDRIVESGRTILVVKVLEKPSVREIKYVGFEAITVSTVSEKVQTKRYTILDERKVNADLRLIEQSYVEKGYYLARANYTTTNTDSGEVILTYSVIENSPLAVERVNLLGNTYYSDAELKNGMFTREKRWASWLNNSGTFKDEFVNRDKEYLSYIYRDNGYAEATVGAPQPRLDTGRQKVELSYYIEEGERFKIGSIKFAGDVLFPLDQVLEKMAMKKDKYFRISQFQADIKTLQDMYGDEGFAFADILPKTTANRETRIIDLEFTIAKGEKVYFRNIIVEGNAKTRDNVVRRNLRVSEGDRFHSTNLEKSKVAIERLGYFQEVQLVREPDQKLNAMDLRIKVKEKSTGTLSASIGASPNSNGRNFSFFAQGQYSEANLVGKGWSAAVSANLTPNGSYGLNLSGTEPSINDGPWSVTVFGSYDYQIEETFANEPDTRSQIRKVGFALGREIIEDLRLSLGYSFERVTHDKIKPVIKPFTKVGDTERLTQSLTYDKTDNYLMPTSGYYLNLTNTYATKILSGTNQFGMVESSVAYYVPVTFGDDFRTNFRFAFEPAYVYPVNGREVPYWERLTLGTLLNMKAYYNEEDQISPRIQLLDSPFATDVRNVAKGGNRRLYGSVEYFFPIIPEANLRLVTFGESGTVLDDNEHFKTGMLKYDVGFGFRWQTPIAPFRFEWAWPIQKGKLGASQFIFMVGNDSATSLGR